MIYQKHNSILNTIEPIDVGIQVELTPDDETKNGMPPATNQIHCDMNKNPLAPEIKEKEEAITIWKALAIPVRYI